MVMKHRKGLEDRDTGAARGRMGLYYRLVTGYLVLLFIMIVPCAVSIYSLSDIEQISTSLAKQNVELSTTVEYLRGVLPSLEAEARRYVTLYKEDAYKAFGDLSRECSEKLASIEKTCPGCIKEETRALSSDLSSLVDLVDHAHEEITRPAEGTPGVPGPSSGLEEEIKLLTSNMMQDLRRIEENLKEDLRDKSESISRQTTQAKQLTTVTFLAALAFALFAPWLLYKYIKRPIDNLRQGALAIGEGRFDQTIPVDTEDELGQLARVFNDMARRLKELDQLKSDFIAVASHELKTPLSSMIEAARLLNEPKLGELNEKQQRLVTILNESMDKFKRLIEELLDLSRLKAGLMPIQRQPADIADILNEILDTLTPLAESRSIELSVAMAEVPEKLSLDRDRMTRAIMNIVQNAIKFSPEGKKVKVCLKRIEWEKGDEKPRAKGVEIGVIDAGPGITADQRDKIFDKFYQIQTIRRKGGIGLGLAIAREIVQAHGGTIWVESPPKDRDAIVDGKGAAFWIRLYSS